MNSQQQWFNPYGSNPGINALPSDPTQQVDTSTTTIGQRSFAGMPLSFWIGALILWFVLKYISEHEGTKLEPFHVGIGGYNTAAIILSWIVGWSLVKLIVSRWFPNSGSAQFVKWL